MNEAPNRPVINGDARAITELLRTPRWHLANIRAIDRVAEFVALDRRDYNRTRFLYLDCLAQCAKRTVDLDVLLALAPQYLPASSVRHIFHIGYCGSTLLTDCLAALEAVLVLREPWTYFYLDRLSRDYIVIGGASQPLSSMVDLVTRAASRTFARADMAVVKPGSSTNLLIPDLLRATGARPGVMVYSTLETYLCQVLKSEWRRQRIRARGQEFVAHRERWLPALTDVIPTTDAEHAAFVWACQMSHFRACLGGDSGSSLRTLTTSAFIAEPERTVTLLAAHFGRPVDDASLNKRLRPVLGYHSKRRDEPFSAHDRRLELLRTMERYRAEVAAGINWVLRHSTGQSTLDSLPQDLREESGAGRSLRFLHREQAIDD